MQLTLYYIPTCPYCLKVLKFMKENHLSISLKDRNASSANYEELIRIGGKPQVPCLVIDGGVLYESEEIIEWLKNNFKI